MNLTSILTNLLWAMPLVLIWVGIAGYAIANYDQHPRRSNLIIASMALFVVARLLSVGAMALVASLMDSFGAGQSSLVYSVVSMATTALSMVGWVLVAAALFAGPEEGTAK